MMNNGARYAIINGYAKLTPFVSSLDRFEIRPVKTSNPSITLKYIRNKR